MGEPKATVFREHEDVLHHLAGHGVVFLEGLLASLEFLLALAFLGPVEVFPLVLHHAGSVGIQPELDPVHAVDVVETHIVLVVVPLQDDGSLGGEVSRVGIGPDLFGSHDQGQGILIPLEVGLHIVGDVDLQDELLSQVVPVHQIGLGRLEEHVGTFLQGIEVVTQYAHQRCHIGPLVQGHLAEEIDPEVERDLVFFEVLDDLGNQEFSTEALHQLVLVEHGLEVDLVLMVHDDGSWVHSKRLGLLVLLRSCQTWLTFWMQ